MELFLPHIKHCHTLFFCFLVLCLSSWQAHAQNYEQLSIFSTSGMRHDFQVEVAREADAREKGLMFRRSLAPNQGMLFDFGEVKPLSMWMKNTYIPLDMIFIRADGGIAGIVENTEPLSTRIIYSPEPVLGVLELGGGVSARLGVKTGDRVSHPAFKKSYK